MTVRVTVTHCMPRIASVGSNVLFKLLRLLLTTLTLNTVQKGERAANEILRVGRAYSEHITDDIPNGLWETESKRIWRDVKCLN